MTCKYCGKEIKKVGTAGSILEEIWSDGDGGSTICPVRVGLAPLHVPNYSLETVTIIAGLQAIVADLR